MSEPFGDQSCHDGGFRAQEPRSAGPRAVSAVTAIRLLTAARVLWGAALLVAPGSVIVEATTVRASGVTQVAARLLGLRHLAEAAFTGRRHSPTPILLGAAVDGTHAATLAVLALIRPDQRRLALTNVATATTFAFAGVAESRWARADARIGK